MEQGTVLRWDTERGFGFIAPDDGGDDIFTHVSGLVKSSDEPLMARNARVAFARAHTDRGPKAVRVLVTATGSEVRAPDYQYEATEDEATGEPVMPTEAAWRALWEKWSPMAFEAFLEFARGNGWVVAEPPYQEHEPQRAAGELRSPGRVQGVPGRGVHRLRQ